MLGLFILKQKSFNLKKNLPDGQLAIFFDSHERSIKYPSVAAKNIWTKMSARRTLLIVHTKKRKNLFSETHISLLLLRFLTAIDLKVKFLDCTFFWPF